MAEHVCVFPRAAGGLIDPLWCFDHMAAVLTQIPPILREADTLRPELTLVDDGPLSLYYCPFDFVNPDAKVVIVGITPGLRQMFLSCQEAQRALFEGLSGDDVLRRACAVGSFAGVMRTNLITMLDGIGLNTHLGLKTTGELFTNRPELLHSTSAILYPVFNNGKNYSGSPSPETFPLLRAFLDQVLANELAMIPDAVVIPLGKTVSDALHRETDQGNIRPDRCLFDFPHPSGANGHRTRLYALHQDDMAAQVAASHS
jgi:uracil-DNA glycosylase